MHIVFLSFLIGCILELQGRQKVEIVDPDLLDDVLQGLQLLVLKHLVLGLHHEFPLC